ncbi:hypothetical protein NH44784_050231 [Achromobacter xylosoxidans NH44784-1996]|nr:hypothetical protein NH44784_050231 [Achromobacter xylosoxidans NH44784-1996]
MRGGRRRSGNRPDATAKRRAGGWSMMVFPRRPPAPAPAAPWKRFLFQE